MKASITIDKAKIKRHFKKDLLTRNEKIRGGISIGNRFAYLLSAVLLLAGIALKSIPLLIFLMIMALGAVVLPFHPFCLGYNYLLKRLMSDPQTLPDSAHLKFIYGIAALWIGMIVILYLNKMGLSGDLVAFALAGIMGVKGNTVE